MHANVSMEKIIPNPTWISSQRQLPPTRKIFGFASTEEYVLKCAGNLDIKIANLSCTTFNITHRPVSIHEDNDP
jgi:hypothetical protein